MRERAHVLSWNGKAIRRNENPGHGCEKQSVQSTKVLCRIMTGCPERIEKEAELVDGLHIVQKVHLAADLDLEVDAAEDEQDGQDEGNGQHDGSRVRVAPKLDRRIEKEVTVIVDHEHPGEQRDEPVKILQNSQRQ